MSNEVVQILGNTAHLSSIGFAVITTDGVINYANPAFCEMFLISAFKSNVGWLLVEHPTIRFNSNISALKSALNSPDSASVQLHFDRDLETLTLDIAALNAGGTRMLVAKRSQRSQIDSASPNFPHYRDPLTGLGNRALLDTTLANWQPSSSEASSLAVLMIDLDRFKKVNDTLGHGAGCQCRM